MSDNHIDKPGRYGLWNILNNNMVRLPICESMFQIQGINIKEKVQIFFGLCSEVRKVRNVCLFLKYETLNSQGLSEIWFRYTINTNLKVHKDISFSSRDPLY